MASLNQTAVCWLKALVLTALILSVSGAMDLSLPSPAAWAQVAPSAPFDDAEAQLRIRQASNAASAAAFDVDEMRKALEAERKRVVATSEERDLNGETIKALEQRLRGAEAIQRDRDDALKEAQEARRRGLAAEAERQKLEDARGRPPDAPTPPQVAAPGTPGWIADGTTGCRVWDAHPEPGETISWTGACQDNLAQGRGVLQWFLNGKSAARYEGEYRDGKLNGQGVYTWVGGSRYEGDFLGDLPNGSGTLRQVNGAIYSGAWTNGCFRQGDRKARVMASAKECGF
ncbi:MAG: hypothetical protein ACHQK9_22680 [Reyranellales bacterium]